MYVRQYFRKVNGQRQAYWALVESYRGARGPRQRIVAWLGQLDEAGRLGVAQAARANSGLASSSTSMRTSERNLAGWKWTPHACG
jgi:hypothetical protein